MKITTDAGPSFFIRTCYLHLVTEDQLLSGAVFNQESETDILDAGLCFSAEHKAVDYLARAEQSRQGLTRKLLTKGFEQQYIDRALDYLEYKNHLSDERFARAWLHMRRIGHYEGRTRLAAELASRGISREISQKVLSDFFEENPEIGQCRKAVDKCRHSGKSEDKMVAYLLRKGFTYSMIRECLSEE
ncbi:MAG: recombination regulator RecX [Treponema sp.]|nr:recombination regulator RecX [Treponema sp.]